MDNYCNNCGNYGHIYKNCRHPILSYGIILYNKEKETNIYRILLVERKDSLSYIEFIRGKYKNPLNYDYIHLLVTRMTGEEKKKLLQHDFDTLWKELWIHIDTVNQRIQKEYLKSKIIFNQLKEGNIKKDKNVYSLQSIIETSSDEYRMNEWEIPKGRRKKYENNKECAIREFREETNIEYKSYQLINNIIPLIEEYRGINNVRYKHIYYIGEINELIKLEVNMENKDQYTEIKNIEWLTEEECYQRIRHYDLNKKGVIQDVFKFLQTDSKYVLFKKLDSSPHQ
tara:strand:- start:717 stop:1568 length:852 start_codon:yes stop_codon:yes gene_type:complete